MTRSFTEINTAIAWQLKESIGEDRFDMWFGDSNAIQVVDGQVLVNVGDQLSLSFVRQQFETTLKESVAAVLGAEASVRFQVAAEPQPASKQNSLFSDQQLSEAGIEPATDAKANTKAKANRKSNRKSRRKLQPLAAEVTAERSNKPCDQQLLESFHFGPRNLLLQTAIKEVFAEPGKFNPLVITGPVGCGKSHLATGMVAEARKTRRFRRCVNVTAEQFTTGFIDGLQRRSLTDFRSKFRNLDLLAIDDIQFLSGKQATIIEFQNTLEALLRGGKQVVVTCDRPINELQFADDSLFTRLSSGLTCPVRYPDLQGRVAIIQQLAAQRGLRLTTAIEKQVAQRISRDVRLLSGAVNRLQAASMVTDRELDSEFVNEYLADLFHSQSPIVSLARIEKAVCDICGVDSAELKSSKRIKRISTARMLAMWLSRKYTSAGLAEIGKFYGGRSHSTVVAANKKVAGLLESNAPIDLQTRRTSISSAVNRLKTTLDVG